MPGYISAILYTTQKTNWQIWLKLAVIKGGSKKRDFPVTISPSYMAIFDIVTNSLAGTKFVKKKWQTCYDFKVNRDSTEGFKIFRKYGLYFRVSIYMLLYYEHNILFFYVYILY